MQRMCKSLQVRHQLNKHSRATGEADLENEIVIDQEVVIELVKQSQDKIYDDEKYPLKFRSVIKNLQFIDGECGLLCGEIVNITQSTKNNNGELFYKLYFGSVVKEAATFFPRLKAPLCTLLAQTLSDNILAEIIVKQNRGNIDDKTGTRSTPISEREGGMVHSILEVMLSASYCRRLTSLEIIQLKIKPLF